MVILIIFILVFGSLPLPTRPITTNKPAVERRINANDYPYNANGSKYLTTAATGLGSRHIMVADAKLFKVGNEINLKGGGPLGKDLIAKVQGKQGNVLTISEPVGISTQALTAQPENTTAIRNAINAAKPIGGTVELEDGMYRCNPTQMTAANSILDFTTTTSDATPIVTIQLRGKTPPAYIAYTGPVPTTGVVLQSDVVGTGIEPAVIADRAYTTGVDPRTDFNRVHVVLTNITVRTTDNPTLHGIRLANSVHATLDNVSVDAGSPQFQQGEPTHGTVGIWMPQVNNHGVSRFTGTVMVAGYYVGVRVSEHWRADYFAAGQCGVGVQIQFSWHPIVADDLNIYHCKTRIEFLDRGILNATIGIERAEGGHWWSPVPGRDVYDPLNRAHGIIYYNIIKENIGETTEPLSVTGASGIKFENLADMNATPIPTPSPSPTPTPSPSPTPSGQNVLAAGYVKVNGVGFAGATIKLVDPSGVVVSQIVTPTGGYFHFGWGQYVGWTLTVTCPGHVWSPVTVNSTSPYYVLDGQ